MVEVSGRRVGNVAAVADMDGFEIVYDQIPPLYLAFLLSLLSVNIY